MNGAFTQVAVGWLLSALLVLGGHQPNCGAEGGLAYEVRVTRDSAVFVFPTPASERWTWYAPDSGRGTGQYRWAATWATAPHIPLRDRGLALTVASAPAGTGLRTGSLAQLIREGRRDALQFGEAGHYDVYFLTPEPALSSHVKSCAVVLVLARSALLDELHEHRPESVVFEVDLRPVRHSERRQVLVQYVTER